MTLSLLISFKVYGEVSGVTKPKEGFLVVTLDERNPLSRTDTRLIKKSIYEVVLYTQRFDLLLDSRIQKELETYNIHAKFKEDKKYFNVELTLQHFPKETLISYVSDKSIPANKLQYRFRTLLYKLLYGANYDDKQGKLLKDVIIPLKKKYTNPTVSSPVKDNKKKSLLSLDIDESIIETTDNNESSEKDNLEILTDSTLNNKNKQKKKKKKKVSISKFESPNIDLTKNAPFKKKVLGVSRENKYITYLNTGVASQESLSETIIKTRTLIRSAFIQAGMSIRGQNEVNYQEYSLKLGKTISDNKYGVSPGFNLNGRYNYSIYKNKVYGFVGAAYQAINFVDLGEEADGLSVWSNKLMWMGAGVRLNLFSDYFNCYLGVYRSLVGNSNLGKDGGEFPLDGSKITMALKAKVYKKWGLGTSVEQVVLESNASADFKAEYTAINGFISYQI